MENTQAFLYCTPSVFVIGNEYEIVINVKEYGLCYVKIGDTVYYEENSGVLPSEKKIAKIRVPQSALDQAKKYTVLFRETEHRKSYYSTFKPVQSVEYPFKPLEKTEDIHIYHVADVHYRFAMAKEMAAFFGEDVDLFVVNGDIGEVETEENFLEVCAFVGDISGGRVPVIFVRGNHDTRGRLSELYPKYFPVEGKNTFYKFEIGCLNGVAIDCGEDKPDNAKEYDSSETPEELRGINRFHEYRQKELEFLKNTTLDTENKIPFAITHVCPMMTTFEAGSIFDIERDCYTKWNEELERMGVKFMLCGHYHKAFLLECDDERNLLAHNYPVLVGSACFPEDLWGAAITLNKTEMKVEFTNKERKVQESFVVKF